MKIRKGVIGDIKQIAPLWLSFFKDDTKKIACDYLKKRVTNGELLVSEIGGKLAGFLTFKKNYFDKSDYIEAVLVFPEYRAKGIGSALIKRCEAQSRKRKCRRLFVSCEPWNKNALNFHVKMGFKKCGYLDNVWGENKTDIFFSKKL